jgi:hypothetical protein
VLLCISIAFSQSGSFCIDLCRSFPSRKYNKKKVMGGKERLICTNDSLRRRPRSLITQRFFFFGFDRKKKRPKWAVTLLATPHRFFFCVCLVCDNQPTDDVACFIIIDSSSP